MTSTNTTGKKKDDWRDDDSLSSTPIYKKKFAIFPVECSDGTNVFMKVYYKKFLVWTHRNSIPELSVDAYFHTDFIENITEEEYIVRKLAENF